MSLSIEKNIEIDFCSFCEKECKNQNSKRNHERLCGNNPDRQVHPRGMLGKISHKKDQTKFTNTSLLQQSITIKNRIENGTWYWNQTGFEHSEETKDLLSKIACDRLQKHSKYSKNTEYSPGIILESSYEVAVATILDTLKIKWEKVRKGYLWDDNGKNRRYIPDFYLPEYDIFLDPKNDYLIKKDKIKIESAQKLNNIKVFVIQKNDITMEYIKNLCSDSVM